MEKRLIPEVRFKGFVGKWEEKRFRDYVKLSQGLQIPIAERLVKETKDSLFYITNEFLNPNSKVKYYIKNAKENVKAHKDDILMTRTGNTGKVITDIEGVFHNNFFKVAYEKQETDKYFLYHLLKSPMIQKEILVRAGTSTIPDLNHGDFYGIKHCTPKTDEQEKIGRLFEKLDQTIDLQGKVVEENKRLKQALLQKLFPQKGQKLPDLRLKGFSGDWAREKLGKLTIKNNKRNKDLKITNVESISNKDGFISQTEQFDRAVASQDLSNYYIIKPKMFGFNPSRINVGSIGYKAEGEETSVVSPLYISFSTNNKVDDMFLWYWLQTNYFANQRKIFTAGSVRETLSYNSFCEIHLIFPSLPEQEAIGNLFRSLDEKIAREEERLEGYKTLKKSLLQKMFV